MPEGQFGDADASGVHPAILKVVLLQAGVQPAHELAERLQESIHGHRQSRSAAREFFGGPGDRSKEDSVYFLPKVYCTVGAFDVAAFYLSPTLYLPSLTDDLASAGQDVHRCLLPRLGARDPNGRFLQSQLKASRDGADERFLCIAKFKLNPLVSWPGRTSTPAEALAHHRALLEKVTQEIDLPDFPVALGLDLGWNELLLLSTHARPHELLELVLRIRSASCGVERLEHQRAHVMATSITTIGYQADLRSSAVARSTCRQPSEIIDAALAATPTPHISEARSTPIDLYIRPAFQVYPGHDARVGRRLAQAVDALVDAGERAANGGLRLADAGCSHLVTAEIGRQDLRGPAITIDPRRPAAAFLFTALLGDWMRTGCDEDDLDVPHIFDSVTRLGSHANSPDLFPEGHQKKSARSVLTEGAPVLERLRAPAVKWFKDSLRSLQMPYALSEQIMNLVSAFSWSQYHEILWEDSVWFAPAMLQLGNHLEAEAHERARRLERLRCVDCPPEVANITHHLVEDDIHTTLRTFRESQEFLIAEVRDLVDSLRTNFNTRHLNSYELDHEADVSIVYRGSAQQLLSIAQMILDVVERALLGPRATIATIGNFADPRVKTRCGVTIVELGTGTASLPLLLECIAHEVTHGILDTTSKLALKPGAANDLRIALLGLKDDHWRLLAEERAGVTLAQTHSERATALARAELELELARERLSECVSDVAEMWLWRTDLHEWCAGFFLRVVLVAENLDADHICDPERRFHPIASAPRGDDDLFRSALERCLFVLVASDLHARNLSAPPNAEQLSAFLDESVAKLRVHLRCQCVVGPSLFVRTVLDDDESWRIFVDGVLRHVRVWWLESAAFGEIKKIFESLDSLTDCAAGAGDEELAQLLEVLRAAFCQLRKATLQVVNPSLHVGHVTDESLRANMRNADPVLRETKGGVQTRKYDLRVRQPLRSPEAEPATLVIRRGAIAPLTLRGEIALQQASASFLRQMLGLLPLWRELMIAELPARRQE